MVIFCLCCCLYGHAQKAKAQSCGTATYYSSNGRDYARCSNTLNWSQAENACNSLQAGWNLTTINDATENTYVNGTVASGLTVWIGINDNTTEGTYVWNQGTSTYTNWGSGEPTTGTMDNCGRMVAAGTWDHGRCTGAGASLQFVCEGAPVCGNSSVSGAETCDDGNAIAGDGCSTTCQTEPGCSCPTPGSACTCPCTTRQWSTLGAGNNEYMYCSAPTVGWTTARTNCQSAGTSWDLATVNSAAENTHIATNGGTFTVWLGYNDCETTGACGNGLTVEGTFSWVGGTSSYTNWAGGQPDNAGSALNNPGQDCATMARSGGTWSDAACSTNTGYVCEGPALCGNGVIGGSEACDDGNTANADGCSQGCTVEDGYTCTGTPSTCTAICTGGVWHRQALSTGNTTEYFFCNTTVTRTAANTNCGNLGSGWSLVKIVDTTENTFVDGLSTQTLWTGLNDIASEGTYVWADSSALGAYTNWAATNPTGGVTLNCVAQLNGGTWDDLGCLTNNRYVCEGPPICGNGIGVPSETCDDGNTINGDGCSASCVVESGYSCTVGSNSSAGGASVCTGSSHAVVSTIRLVESAGERGIEWTTLSESGTLGFVVSVFDQRASRWKPLHNGMIVGLHEAFAGGVYRVFGLARGLANLQYRIEEVERTGGATVVSEGMLSSNDVVSVTSEQAVATPNWHEGLSGTAIPSTHRWALRRAPIALALPSKSNLPQVAKLGWPPELPIHTKHVSTHPVGLRFETRIEGLHRVSLFDLSSRAALSSNEMLARVQDHHLMLSDRGKPVPYYFDKNTNQLIFYAAASTAMYSANRVYQLRFADAQSMKTASAPPTTRLSRSGIIKQTFEQDTLFAAAASTNAEQDNWYWAALSAGSGHYETFTTELDLGAMDIVGDAELEIVFNGAWGLSETSAQRMAVHINDTPIGVIEVKRMGNQSMRLPLQSAALRSGKNVLTLYATSGAPAGTVGIYVDRFLVVSVRSLRSDQNTLQFKALTSGITEVVLPLARYFVYDIDTGERVQTVAPSNQTTESTIAIATQEGHTYAISAIDRMAQAFNVAPIVDRGLSSGGLSAEYLIIAPESLVASAARLGNYRKAQGLKAAVVGLRDIYDAYSYGYPTPYAIHDFLRYAYEQGAVPLRYVVLLGNGSFDYKGVTAEGPGLIPPKLLVGDGGLSASDVWYADVVNDDLVPEFAIGRLPVTTEAEASQLVDRMVKYEEHLHEKYAHDALALVGATRRDNFSQLAAPLAEELLDQGNSVYVAVEQLGPQAARGQIIRTLNDGVFWFSYLGHAGVSQLDDGALLREEDLASMTSGKRFGIWTAMTCSAARFEIPGVRSLAESAMLATHSQSVAFWSDTSLSYAYPAARLSVAFASRMQTAIQSADQERLGDVLLSLHHSALDEAFSRAMMKTYVLLGDPALRLPRTATLTQSAGAAGAQASSGCAVTDASVGARLVRSPMIGCTLALALFARRRLRHDRARRSRKHR